MHPVLAKTLGGLPKEVYFRNCAMVQRVAGAGLGPPALHFYLCGHEARPACRLAMHGLEAAWP